MVLKCAPFKASHILGIFEIIFFYEIADGIM
jgi:hypothetical protein